MSPFLLGNSLGFFFVQWDIWHWLLSGGGLRLTGKWGLRVQACTPVTEEAKAGGWQIQASRLAWLIE